MTMDAAKKAKNPQAEAKAKELMDKLKRNPRRVEKLREKEPVKDMGMEKK